MTPELPALLTPESSGLLSSGFFLEKELVLANFGRDSKGDSVFLLEDDKIFQNKQTTAAKKYIKNLILTAEVIFYYF